MLTVQQPFVFQQNRAQSLGAQTTADLLDPPSPTGQYPDPVWMEQLTFLQQSSMLDGSETAPIPPSATGQYPEAVWSHPSLQSQEAIPMGGEAPLSSAVAVTETTDITAKTWPVATESDRSLSFKEGEYADAVDATPVTPLLPLEGQTPLLLDFQEMYHIIRAVAEPDSGATPFTAFSADQEFSTPNQSGYQRRQFGLGFGIVLFTQESGLLGKLLQIMQRRNPARFAELFAPHGEQLLATTNASTGEERLQPVGEQPLWSASWIERFQRAGEEPTFQIAQNETAIEFQFRPMLKIAFSLGFRTDRALAMVYDRVVTRGLGGGLRWIVAAAAPIQTVAQRQHALTTLGYANLLEFQNSTNWTPLDGQFGIETHAALVDALRQQGKSILPTPMDLMARLVSAAQGNTRLRLLRLQDLPVFEDIPYRLP